MSDYTRQPTPLHRPITPGPGPSTYAPRSSGMATASLVLGLISVPAIFLCIGWLTAILAIVFGFIGLSAVKKGGGRISGKGRATAGIVSGFAAILIYGLFLAWGFKQEANRPEAEKAASRALRETENLLIGSTGGAGRGESEAERRLASEFSEAFEMLHHATIRREKKDGTGSGEVEGSFVAACDLTDHGCVFLAKVPDYKRHTDDAKETVEMMAWLAANQVLAAHPDDVPQGTPLLVALKGIALYGAIMIGETGASDPDATGTDKETIKTFYQNAAAAEPAGE